MKPLIILLSVFTVALGLTKLFRGNFKIAFSGRIAMSVMLLFTAAGHFMFTTGMAMMLPPFIPYAREVVYLTGVFEGLAAIALLVPKFRTVAAWLLIIFFILVLPANIYAAVHRIDYQTGTFDGNGLKYLWFRIPLQIFFIVWVYLSAQIQPCILNWWTKRRLGLLKFF